MITTNHTTQVLNASIKFENSQRALLRMMSFMQLAKSAYSEWMELIDQDKTYERAAHYGEVWTLAFNKKEIHDKAMRRLAVYIRCMAWYNTAKKSL